MADESGVSVTAADDYVVVVTDPADNAAVQAIEACQQTLVADHLALYSAARPRARKLEWALTLNCGRVAAYIKHGVVVLRVVEAKTGAVLGFLSYGIRIPAVFVHHFVVKRESRGKGLGKKLWDAMMQRIASHPQNSMGNWELRVGVAGRNRQALGWYERLGFEGMGRHLVALGGPSARCGVIYFVRMRCLAAEVGMAPAKSKASKANKPRVMTRRASGHFRAMPATPSMAASPRGTEVPMMPKPDWRAHGRLRRRISEEEEQAKERSPVLKTSGLRVRQKSSPNAAGGNRASALNGAHGGVPQAAATPDDGKRFRSVLFSPASGKDVQERKSLSDGDSFQACLDEVKSAMLKHADKLKTPVKMKAPERIEVERKSFAEPSAESPKKPLAEPFGEALAEPCAELRAEANVLAQGLSTSVPEGTQEMASAADGASASLQDLAVEEESAADVAPALEPNSIEVEAGANGGASRLQEGAMEVDAASHPTPAALHEVDSEADGVAIERGTPADAQGGFEEEQEAPQQKVGAARFRRRSKSAPVLDDDLQ